jgi:hypothetical protein
VKRDLLVGYSIADGLEPSPPELRRCPFLCQHVIGRRVDDENGNAEVAVAPIIGSMRPSE